MPGGLIDIDIKMVGVNAVSRKLAIARGAIKDLRPAWKAIHNGRPSDPLLKASRTGPQVQSFTRIMELQFKTKGRRGGTPWVGYDNEPRYRPIKFLLGGGLDNILRWTPGRERLFPSLTNVSHADHVFKAGRRSVVMGTSVPYAIRHQKGLGVTKFDKIRTPKRPIIALTKRDVRGWARAIQRHIQRAVDVRGKRVFFTQSGGVELR